MKDERRKMLFLDYFSNYMAIISSVLRSSLIIQNVLQGDLLYLNVVNMIH